MENKDSIAKNQAKMVNVGTKRDFIYIKIYWYQV
jgi:hypothetical protein